MSAPKTLLPMTTDGPSRAGAKIRLQPGAELREAHRTEDLVAHAAEACRVISDAIHRKRLLGMTYRHYSRCVEPHFLGTDQDGRDTLIAWQVTGGSDDGVGTGWKQFLIADLAGVRMLDDTFSA